MEVFVLLLILASAGYWFYKAGKHEGSRKGYHAGRQRGRGRK
jgi:hypothetical protein